MNSMADTKAPMGASREEGGSDAPERIYLQAGDEFERTWCADRINDDDVPYVRADLAAPASPETQGVHEEYAAWMDDHAALAEQDAQEARRLANDTSADELWSAVRRYRSIAAAFRSPAAAGTAQPVGEDTLHSALAAIAGRKEDMARWLEQNGSRSQSAADLAADAYPPGNSNVAALQARVAELADFAIAARTVAKTALHIAAPSSPGERTPEPESDPA